jgi:hypothetical protein
LAEWWSYDFYELRNSIVHGDNVPPERLKYNNKFSHIDIADIVFYECMIDIILGFYLYDRLSLGDKCKLILFGSKIKDNSIKNLTSELWLSANSIHKAFGWIK